MPGVERSPSGLLRLFGSECTQRAQRHVTMRTVRKHVLGEFKFTDEQSVCVSAASVAIEVTQTGEALAQFRHVSSANAPNIRARYHGNADRSSDELTTIHRRQVFHRHFERLSQVATPIHLRTSSSRLPAADIMPSHRVTAGQAAHLGGQLRQAHTLHEPKITDQRTDSHITSMPQAHSPVRLTGPHMANSTTAFQPDVLVTWTRAGRPPAPEAWRCPLLRCSRVRPRERRPGAPCRRQTATTRRPQQHE